MELGIITAALITLVHVINVLPPWTLFRLRCVHILLKAVKGVHWQAHFMYFVMSVILVVSVTVARSRLDQQPSARLLNTLLN